MPSRWNIRDIAGAGIFVFAGALALWIARDYPMGTITRMGAGFFPISLAILLLMVGTVLAVTGSSEAIEPLGFRWKPFILIPAGILIWALLIDRLGFVAATIPMVLCCAAAECETTWRSATLLCLGLVIGGYFLFIEGIGLPISLWGE